MTRRLLGLVQSALKSWETRVNDNITALGQDGKPMTVPEQSTPASLPAANQHDRSVIFVNHAKLGWGLFEDDGTDYYALSNVVTIELSGGLAGAQTLINLRGEALGFGDLGAALGIDKAVAFKTRIFAYAVNSHHNNGSDPGDWTLTVRNVSDSVDRTVTTIGMAATSTTDEVTAGSLGTVLDMDPGERWRAWMSGPSCTAPFFAVTLYARVYVPKS